MTGHTVNSIRCKQSGVRSTLLAKVGFFSAMWFLVSSPLFINTQSTSPFRIPSKGDRGGEPRTKPALHAVLAQVKNPPEPGSREIVKGPNGDIVVTNQNGEYYACDAKCPHLGLPMKQGKIEIGPDGNARISCSFHNSQFDMKTGECTRWITGVLGMENDMFAGLMQKVGNEKQNIKTYDIIKADNGYLSIVDKA